MFLCQFRHIAFALEKLDLSHVSYSVSGVWQNIRFYTLSSNALYCLRLISAILTPLCYCLINLLEPVINGPKLPLARLFPSMI